MVSWILVIIALLALVVFFKTTGVRFGKTWTILIGVLILFFALSFSFVLIKTGADTSSFDGLVSSFEVYSVWLKGFFGNVATITGNAVSADWTANLTSTGR